ncbi:uncharacterized protein B0T23DRAFT_383884 [Neurospora hispaniola]|uniref:Secreted protein n=1 Tax=Neurospora hispaniola TaxID=588809 RepID=A0AAJ0MP18_9PEZI|nr:hypothetical protein B0T23DRAFT_383884 [Neurospora hispaniola]
MSHCLCVCVCVCVCVRACVDVCVCQPERLRYTARHRNREPQERTCRHWILARKNSGTARCDWRKLLSARVFAQHQQGRR